jgi:uncharacterized membrane protein SpoIIM required for sporulation
MHSFVLKSAQFRREREASWRELEALLARAESAGVRGLSRQHLQRLPTLYRGIVGSLSVARAISLDRNLLEYLANLADRAYVLVYATKRRPGSVVREFAAGGFPRAVRSLGGFLIVSLACLVAGLASGYLLTREDPEKYYSLVPLAVAQGRDPGSSAESLRAALYDRKGSPLDTLNLFASFLFSHNAKIGMLCFALGFAAGIPTVFLLFENGMLLGAMAALYHSRGLALEFWAWILPHGITELLAVCLCGAAGLEIGMALVFPGRWTRLTALTARGRSAAPIVIGAVGMFFVAALIEGLFRQRIQDVPFRIAMAAGTLAAWGCYFWFAGRGKDRGI